jgi:hypothetical protein
MSGIAFPFRRLSSEAVNAGDWCIVRDNGIEPLSERLSHWDYSTPLQLKRQVAVDMNRAAADLGLAAGSFRLKLAVLTGTGTGRYPRRISHSIKVGVDESASAFDIHLPLDSWQLSGRLNLETLLVLSGDAESAEPLSPALDGSRLWNDRHIMDLEAAAPRFPMEAVSFSTFLPGTASSDALWHLDWSPTGIDRDFLGVVRLYLNADRPEFIERVQSADPLTMQEVLGSVIGQMLLSVVLQPDAEELLAEASEGSAGAVIRAWTESVFPGLSASGIRSMVEQRPATFWSSINAYASVGAGGSDE